jgi:hypothetical protein
MNIVVNVTNPETGEETQLLAYRTKSGRLALQQIREKEETPLELAARLRFTEAAQRARGQRFTGPLPPAAEAVSAYQRGPIPLDYPVKNPSLQKQLKYRSWLGDDLPWVEETVLGSPNVRSRAEETVASRVAKERGMGVLLRSPPRSPPPRPPREEIPPRPRPL